MHGQAVAAAYLDRPATGAQSRRTVVARNEVSGRCSIGGRDAVVVLAGMRSVKEREESPEASRTLTDGIKVDFAKHMTRKTEQ